MAIPSYVNLTRTNGLVREMNLIANNIANISTVGFRKEGVVFSEMVQKVPAEGGAIAMTAARTGYTDAREGPLRYTGAPFDLAIAGDAFFQVQTDEGAFLTRAGNFLLTTEGTLALSSGAVLLGAGGAPLQLPDNLSGLSIGPDGTVATADGPVDQVGLWQPAEGARLSRADGVLFETTLPPEPNDDLSTVLQGTLEGSNVSPVEEMARMIAVQRAYEFSQSFMTDEDDRVRSAVRLLGESR